MIFAVAILKDSKQLLVIPTKCCEVFVDKSNAYFLNNGIVPYQETKLFYSAPAHAGKKTEEQKQLTFDFNKSKLEIINGNKFNTAKNGYYIGFILRVFAELSFIIILFLFIIRIYCCSVMMK